METPEQSYQALQAVCGAFPASSEHIQADADADAEAEAEAGMVELFPPQNESITGIGTYSVAGWLLSSSLTQTC